MAVGIDTVNARDDSRRRVLVVDDEPSILDSVATSLRYEGYLVEEAATGRELLFEQFESCQAEVLGGRHAMVKKVLVHVEV